MRGAPGGDISVRRGPHFESGVVCEAFFRASKFSRSDNFNGLCVSIGNMYDIIMFSSSFDMPLIIVLTAEPSIVFGHLFTLAAKEFEALLFLTFKHKGLRTLYVPTGEVLTEGLTGEVLIGGLTGKVLTEGLTGEVLTGGLTGKVLTWGLTGEVLTWGLTGEILTGRLTGEVLTAGLTGEVLTAGLTGEVLTEVFTWFFFCFFTKCDSVSCLATG